MEEMNLISSQIITMLVGHQRRIWNNGRASLLCSCMVYFTAQTMRAINRSFTHTHTHTHTHPFLGCFGLGSLRPFFAYFMHTARASHGLHGFTFERAQNTGDSLLGVSHQEISPPASFSLFISLAPQGVIICICPWKILFQDISLMASHAAWMMALQINMSRKFHPAN